MNFKKRLPLVGLGLLIGCASDYVAKAIPKDHPANPQAQMATYAPHRNPLSVAPTENLKKRSRVAQRKTQVEGEGKVIAVVPTSEQIVINHGKIEGFMDAMTMGYKVSSPSLLQDLKQGDQIQFIIDTEAKKIVKIIKKN